MGLSTKVDVETVWLNCANSWKFKEIYYLTRFVFMSLPGMYTVLVRDLIVIKADLIVIKADLIVMKANLMLLTPKGLTMFFMKAAKKLP